MPRDDLALAVLELVVDVVALGLADALVDDLLRRLRGDAAELLARVLEVDQLAELLVLLASAVVVLGAVEHLEQQLVAELGLEAGLARLRDRDLAALDRVVLVDDVDDQEQIDRAGLGVELRFHLAVHAERALRGREDRLLERADQHALVDVLVSAYLLENHVEFGFHRVL